MGRQPTSGYCQTCRKRRVKCDKARPQCSRCLASGHTCGGYEPPLRMQVLGVHAESNGTQRLVRVTEPANPIFGTRVLPSREEAASSYFFNTFHWAPFWRPLLLSATKGNFPEINKFCLQALTCGYMGLCLGDEALKVKGQQLYGRVLSGVQFLLSQPAKAELAKLGFSMIIMGMYELTVNSVMGRAPPHHVGVIQILQHCGPETFQDENLLEVYRSCRALLLCQALCRQSRCFLEDESWKTLPWQHLPKTFEDRLMDIFLDLPGIAEAVVVPANRPACLDKIHTLSMTLQQWRWDWHAVNSASVRLVRNESHGKATTPHARPSIVSETLLAATLAFDTPRLALDILFYNAALLYLRQLETVARGNAPQPEVLSPDDERYIRRQATLSVSSGHPLLLPSQVRFRCQAAMEAYMTLPCVAKLLATTPRMVTVVTPASIGIVYWVLREHLKFGQDDPLTSEVSKQPLFQDPETVYAGYFVAVGGGRVAVGGRGIAVGGRCS